MAHGSAAAWGHLNLLGEYDFSEDKLQDSVGIVSSRNICECELIVQK
jgi:hypothetical protein